jgi:hypothetical protein
MPIPVSDKLAELLIQKQTEREADTLLANLKAVLATWRAFEVLWGHTMAHPIPFKQLARVGVWVRAGPALADGQSAPRFVPAPRAWLDEYALSA